MSYLGSMAGRKYSLHVVGRDYKSFLEMDRPFVALVYSDIRDFSELPWSSVIGELLKNGARYLVCAGSAASQLEGMFDRAIVEGRWETRRREAIVTTAHLDMDDALQHFFSAAFPERSQPRYGLVVLPERKERLARKMGSVFRV